MKNNFTVVIPARIDSSRLPKKPLLKIGDKSLIQRVCELAEKVSPTRIIVATDSKKIKNHVEDIGFESILTSTKHSSGLDRVNEVVNKLHFDEDEPILNIQGDEPFIPINIIKTVGQSINKGSDICTASCEFENDEDIINTNNVKVVTSLNGFALYFSRAVIPNRFTKDAHIYYKHIGIYGYTKNILNKLSVLKSSSLENAEKLEQLRFLENGYKIKVINFNCHPPIGIDTPEDLEKANLLIKNEKV